MLDANFEYKGSRVDQRFITAAAGTAVVRRLVELGIQVMMQVSLVPEVPFAGGAKVVCVTLMFMEFCVAVENLFMICFICRASRGLASR